MKTTLMNIIRKYGYIEEGKATIEGPDGKKHRKTALRLDKKDWTEVLAKYDNIDGFATYCAYAPEVKKYWVILAEEA